MTKILRVQKMIKNASNVSGQYNHPLQNATHTATQGVKIRGEKSASIRLANDTTGFCASKPLLIANIGAKNFNKGIYPLAKLHCQQAHSTIKELT